MSFFEDASLVMIPSGYKASKVYSVKPTDGTGDLTFTRSNDTATRVGPDGLIEKVRTNLVSYSEQFDNAYWTKQAGTVVTANQAISPDGSQNADLVVGTGNGIFVSAINVPTTTANTKSVYLKGVSGGEVVILQDPSQTVGNTVCTLTTSWQRFTLTEIQNGGIAGLWVAAIPAGGIYIWGAQLETGDIATDYIPTTTAAVSVGPVANVPRLDYSGGSSCPRLLLEPQRTNLVTFSEQLNTGSGGTSAVTANTQVSPDGYTNADTIGAGYWTKSTSQAAGAYTLSVFAKYQSSASILLYIYDGAYYQGSFNLQTGVATSSTGSPSVSMVSYGNGWYRCIVTATTASTISEVGFGSGNFYGYGLQFELGSYATSYIPTLGAAVTRGADAASKTSASALIGQTEGTVFWEFEFTTSAAAGHECILNIDSGAFGNTVYLFKAANGSIIAEMYNGAVAQASFSISSQPAGTYKVAIGYANNNTAFFVNGVQVGSTDTSCSIPTMSRIQLGNGVIGPSTDKTAQVLLFPTRLSNADLADLTA